MSREIWVLAWPNILSNLSVPMIGIADMAMMGHLGSPVFIGAVALGSILFNFIYSGLAFLRMGTTGLTAQTYGAGNIQGCTLLLYRASFIALGLAMLLILLSRPMASLGFTWIEGSNETLEKARSYFYIRIWAAPAVLLQYAIHGWFIGMQDAKSPMKAAISENILNIFFNLIMVFGWGLESDGVAWGTVMARYTGLIISLRWLLGKYRDYLTRIPFHSLMEYNSLIKFFKISGNLFVRNVLLMTVLSAFTMYSSAMGENTLAANSLLLQFFFFFSYLIDGYAYAAEALTGKYTGRSKFRMLRWVIRRTFILAGCLSLFFSVLYFAGGAFILDFLTTNETIRTLGSEYLIYITMIPLLSFAAFLWDGIYIGATATSALRNAMILASLIFFLAYDLLSGWYNHGLWTALLLFLIARGTLLTLMAPNAILHRRHTAEN